MLVRGARMTVLRRIRQIWVSFGVVALIASPIVMFLMFRAQGLPPDTFVSTPELLVTESDMYVRFQPASAGKRAWMIIPGCPADPHAYAPLARRVALHGVLSVIVKVPYRCAPWPAHQDALRQRVAGVIDSCFDCEWTLAGHSRGARHALEVARALPPGRIASLVLIGSTHPREESYASLRIPVLKILGSEDGVAPVADSLARRDLLPAASRWEVIEGGNHAQFGYYGYQLWDRPATITREQQHDRATELLLSVIHVKK
jgi:pimeloyl-ACP methyl ester carboxylesterase